MLVSILLITLLLWMLVALRFVPLRLGRPAEITHLILRAAE